MLRGEFHPHTFERQIFIFNLVKPRTQNLNLNLGLRGVYTKMHSINFPHDTLPYKSAECEPDTGGVREPLMVHLAGVSHEQDQGVYENTKRKYQNCSDHETPHLIQTIILFR